MSAMTPAIEPAESTLFFIAVIPPPELCEAITQVKEDFHQRFHSRHALRLIPHITLKAPFSVPSSQRGMVTDWFNTIPATVGCFEQRLEHFNCFRNKRNPVIFIVPELNSCLQQLQRIVIAAFKERFPELPVSPNELEFKPHITVAYRDLTYANFIAAWNEYAEKKFDTAFRVENFYLLQHDKKQWNVVASHSLA